MKPIIRGLAITPLAFFAIMLSPAELDLSKRITELTVENTKLKLEIANLNSLIIEKDFVLTEFRWVNKAVKYFNVKGFDNGYCKNPEHLAKIWQLCRKWKHLVHNDIVYELGKMRITPELWMYATAMNETCFSPNVQYKNTNGTTDYGITQINDCNVARLNRELPKELKGRDVRTDLEANIAGRYIWMNDRHKMGMTWMHQNKDRGWKFLVWMRDRP